MYNYCKICKAEFRTVMHLMPEMPGNNAAHSAASAAGTKPPARAAEMLRAMWSCTAPAPAAGSPLCITPGWKNASRILSADGEWRPSRAAAAAPPGPAAAGAAVAAAGSCGGAAAAKEALVGGGCGGSNSGGREVLPDRWRLMASAANCAPCQIAAAAPLYQPRTCRKRLRSAVINGVSQKPCRAGVCVQGHVHTQTRHSAEKCPPFHNERQLHQMATARELMP